MDDLLLPEDELPEALRAWLAQRKDQPSALVLVADYMPDGKVLLRSLPDVAPELIARVRVTISKYHEALTNLT
jgi:hypothetical protein